MQRAPRPVIMATIRGRSPLSVESVFCSPAADLEAVRIDACVACLVTAVEAARYTLSIVGIASADKEA